MFTGIVEELGEIAGVDTDGERARLHVRCGDVLGGTAVGDSVSVNGCCLTVTSLPGDGFTADLMAETLRATALGALSPGDPVNLERPLRPDGRLGGHLVQGHVDGVGEVTDRREQPGTVVLAVRAPDAVARYLVPKGSVTVDGVSLTVVDVAAAGVFTVGLIPHTLAVTTLGGRGPGDPVNLEVDVIAKYVERLLAAGVRTPYTDLAGGHA